MFLSLHGLHVWAASRDIEILGGTDGTVYFTIKLIWWLEWEFKVSRDKMLGNELLVKTFMSAHSSEIESFEPFF